MSELQPLERAECLQLLAAHRFGRLAVNINGQAPMVRPVNYLFDERSSSIIFRTGDGPTRHQLLASRKAAFEVDHVHLGSRTGWSVLVRGLVEEISDPHELHRLERVPLDPWAPGERAHWMRIRAWTVTGRRIVEPEAYAAQSVVSRNSSADRLG